MRPIADLSPDKCVAAAKPKAGCRRWRLVLIVGSMLLLGFAARGGAQTADERAAMEDENLETDRDSFTPATSTVGRAYTVLESSYSFIDNRIGPETHSFPELLLRRGITDWFELRLGWNFEAGGSGSAVSGDEFGDDEFQAEKEGSALYGAKIQTSRQSGWTPESSTIVHATTPTSGPAPATTLVVGETFGWTFANGWKWNSAMRFAAASADQDHFDQWAPSTVIKIPVGERWNFHTEYFGIVSSGKESNFSQQFISVGGHVLLTDNFELGLRIGFGLNEQTPRFFDTFGIGWRF